MRYVKRYEIFKNEDLNEEFLGKLYNAAKGALKAFIGNISAPFKNLKDEFKKGMEREQVRKTMISKMDSLLKAATDGINKAEDEQVLSDMRLDFGKQIDDQIAEFDLEIKSVKESNTINESKIKDALIDARVAFGMVRKKISDIKADFDKKFTAAADLQAKKIIVISEIKTIVDDFKKSVMNDEVFKKLETDYKTTNKITDVTPGTYSIGDELIYLRSGQTKKSWDSLTDIQKKSPTTDPLAKKIVNIKKVEKIEGDNYTFIGKDGKEIIKKSVEIIGKSELPIDKEVDVDKLKTDLGSIKADKEQIGRVAKFVDFIKTKPDKLPEVDKLLGETDIE